MFRLNPESETIIEIKYDVPAERQDKQKAVAYV